MINLTSRTTNDVPFFRLPRVEDIRDPLLAIQASLTPTFYGPFNGGNCRDMTPTNIAHPIV